VPNFVGVLLSCFAPEEDWAEWTEGGEGTELVGDKGGVERFLVPPVSVFFFVFFFPFEDVTFTLTPLIAVSFFNIFLIFPSSLGEGGLDFFPVFFLLFLNPPPAPAARFREFRAFPI
jgi:hypothetical protein